MEKEIKFSEKEFLKFAIANETESKGLEQGIRDIYKTIEEAYNKDDLNNEYERKLRYAYSILDTTSIIVGLKGLEEDREKLLLITDQLRELADFIDTLVVR